MNEEIVIRHDNVVFAFSKVTRSKIEATAELQGFGEEIKGKLFFQYDGRPSDRNPARWNWEFKLEAGDGYKESSKRGQLPSHTSNLDHLINPALNRTVEVLDQALMDAVSHRRALQEQLEAESRETQRLWRALKTLQSE